VSLIDSLANQLGWEVQRVRDYLVLSPNKYKVYTIPKRTHGHRVIAHPAKDLKELQRAFLALYAEKLPIHVAAMAYRKGIGIKNNAQAHQHNSYLLKLDLESFFHSIKSEAFLKYLYAFDGVNELFTEEDRIWLKKLLFWCPSKRAGAGEIAQAKHLLSIGAPTSPHISNFYLYKFDQELAQFCNEQGIVYTRYADDLTFSTQIKGVLIGFVPQVEDILRKHFDAAMRVNRMKTALSSKGHNRHVTGVTISNEGWLSIGREKKRYLFHLVHQFTLNQLNQKQIEKLRGLVAFAYYLDPSLHRRLSTKYSSEVIQNLIKDKQL
jgi:retron-type reverse transcriptase